MSMCNTSALGAAEKELDDFVETMFTKRIRGVLVGHLIDLSERHSNHVFEMVEGMGGWSFTVWRRMPDGRLVPKFNLLDLDDLDADSPGRHLVRAMSGTMELMDTYTQLYHRFSEEAIGYPGVVYHQGCSFPAIDRDKKVLCMDK